jgi:hypothetical protein
MTPSPVSPGAAPPRPHARKPTPAPLAGAAPSHWLTRTEVAKRLGLSKTSVRRLEDGHQLARAQDADGNWRFDPVEVDALAAARGADQPSPRSALLTVPPSAADRAATGASSSRAAPAAAIDVDARVFDLLAQGYSLRDIVRELRLPALAVEAAARSWERLLAAEARVPPASVGERVDELEVAASEQHGLNVWLLERVFFLEQRVAELSLRLGAIGAVVAG